MINEMLIQQLHNDGLDEVAELVQSQADKITELEDLAQMIIDADSADERLRPMMHHVWLCKAQRLLGSSK